VAGKLKPDFLVFFDKGTNSIRNTTLIRVDNVYYITNEKLNKSDDEIIAKFEDYDHDLIDFKSGNQGIMILKPNNINYLYFSRKYPEGFGSTIF
jgi:transposase